MHGGGKRIDDSTLYAAFKQYFAKPGNRNTVPENGKKEPLQTGRTQGAGTASGGAASVTSVPLGSIAKKMRTNGRVLSDELYALLVANYWVMTSRENNKGETLWFLERDQDMQDRQYAAAYAAFYRANKGQQPRKYNIASKVWGLDLGIHLDSFGEYGRNSAHEDLINVLQENNVSIKTKNDSGKLFADWVRGGDVHLVPVTEDPPVWWPEDSAARLEAVEDSEYSADGLGSRIAGPSIQPASLALGYEPALPQSDNNASSSASRQKISRTIASGLRVKEIDAWFADAKNHGKVPVRARSVEGSESAKTLNAFYSFWPNLRRQERYADSLDDPMLKALQAGGAPLSIQEKPTESRPDRVGYKLNDEKAVRIRIDSDSVARILSVHGLKPSLGLVPAEGQMTGVRLEELEAWFKEHPGKTPVIPSRKSGARNRPEELWGFYDWWENIKYHTGLSNLARNKPFVEMFDREGVPLVRRVKEGIEKIFVDDTPQMRVSLGDGARAAIIALYRARGA
ncbi:hypothetical protein ACWDYK_39925, partial [Streptomyces anthocyanicus]